MRSDISFNIFTNENYFNINYVTVPQLIKNTQGLNVKINLISNKFPQHERFVGVNYIESNVPFDGSGHHFRNTMLYALERIEEKYVFFLCDDYIFRNPVKEETFNSISKILDELGGDFLSLSTQKHMGAYVNDWSRVELDLPKYGFPGGSLRYMPDEYCHMYSVQPCVWKKESLMELLQYNNRLSLHDLDNLNIVNKKGERRERNPEILFYHKKPGFFDYGFKNIGIYLDPIGFNADERIPNSDYLIIDYCEIIRHGKIMEADTNSKKYFLELIETGEYKNIKEKLNKFF
jgi:hypothetical protein